MSQMEIQFKFSPIGFDEQIESLLGLKNLKNKQALFAPQRDFVRTASITVIETGQTLDVHISGRVWKIDFLC